MKTLRLHVQSEHQEVRKETKIKFDADFVQKDCKTYPQCNKLFFGHYNVMRHIQTEHERSDRWQCEECEKSFSNKYSLNYHVKACHVKDYISTCPVFEETFNTVAEYCKYKKAASSLSGLLCSLVMPKTSIIMLIQLRI